MKNLVKSTALPLILTVSISAFAEDFTAYTTEQLLEMRSTTSTMSEENRLLFQNEMQSRVSTMTPEEREVFRSDNNTRRNATGPADGSGNRYSLGATNERENRYGMSSTGGGENRYGKGSSNGQGSMNRYRYQRGGGGRH